MDQRWRWELSLEHRHDDGSWGRLEPKRAHHDAAEHDPERDWADGRIYTCTTCDEQVRVRIPEDGSATRD